MLKITEDLELSPEKKKFDNRFLLLMVVIAVIGVVFIVSDANYLHVRWLYPIGFVLIALVVVANLVKGNIDWRAKKKRDGEAAKPKFSAEEIEAMGNHAEPSAFDLKKKAKEDRRNEVLARIKQEDADLLVPQPRRGAPVVTEEATLVPLIAVSTADSLTVDFARNIEAEESARSDD